MWERIGIIVVVSLIMFFRTLRLGFVSDDIPAAKHNIKPNNVFQRVWWQLEGRKHFGKEEAHAYTLVLHTLTCVFIYLGLGKSDISFLAALLFCVNPRNNQASIWISGRRNYLIPTCLLMAAAAIPLVSPFALFLTTTMATAFVAPIGFLGSPNWWFVLFMPVIWYINIKKFRQQVGGKISVESAEGDKILSLNKLVLAIKTYGFYFFMCLVPDKLSFYHSFLQSGAGSGNEIMCKRAYALDKTFWFGCFLLTAFPLYWIFHGWDGICWGIFWFSVCIAPYLNVIRVQQETADRYVYMAGVGLMFALACVLVAFPSFALAILAVYAVRLFYLIPAYKDEYWLREMCVQEDPMCWFAWHMRALNRWDVGSRHEAFTCWVMAKLISPKEFKIWANLAMVLRKIGNRKESDAAIEEARKCIIKGQEAQSEKLLRGIKACEKGKMPILI